jgi:hypothetical protein
MILEMVILRQTLLRADLHHSYGPFPIVEHFTDPL